MANEGHCFWDIGSNFGSSCEDLVFYSLGVCCKTLVTDKSCQLQFADEKVPLARAESHWTLVSTHHNAATCFLGVHVHAVRDLC